MTLSVCNDVIRIILKRCAPVHSYFENWLYQLEMIMKPLSVLILAVIVFIMTADFVVFVVRFLWNRGVPLFCTLAYEVIDT